MSKTFSLIALGMALTVLGGCSKLTLALKSRFTTGEKEIRSAFAAKDAAKSWRMKTRLAVHDDKVMETTFEVSCPDRQRIRTTVAGEAREMVRIGKRFYVNQDGTWYVLEVNDTDWSPCGKNSGAPSPWAMLNEGREMVTVFANAKDKFSFSRGAVVQLASTVCQEWQVQLAAAGPSMGHGMGYRICLAPDHLPTRIVMGQGGLVTEYSDWNQPISIEPPSNAVPYTEPPAHKPELKRHGP